MSTTEEMVIQLKAEKAKLQKQAERLFDKTLELATENRKLREEVEQWHRLTAGIELPKYPITQFQPKDLERENAKLRELLHEALLFGDEKSYQEIRYRLKQQARELGVEVDG